MENRKQGDLVVLILWIVFFWPVAIWYWFNRVWAKELFQNVVSQDEITISQTKEVLLKNETKKTNKVEENKGVK